MKKLSTFAPAFQYNDNVLWSKWKARMCRESKKTLKKFWIERRGFTTFAAPIKRGAKWTKVLRSKKNLKKDLVWWKFFHYFCRPNKKGRLRECKFWSQKETLKKIWIDGKLLVLLPPLRNKGNFGKQNKGSAKSKKNLKKDLDWRKF